MPAPRRGFNYPPQLRGMTRAAPGSVPTAPGYVVDHTRDRVGTGTADFEAVKALLQRWGYVPESLLEPCEIVAHAELTPAQPLPARVGVS